jgi:hypothetical protein
MGRRLLIAFVAGDLDTGFPRAYAVLALYIPTYTYLYAIVYLLVVRVLQLVFVFQDISAECPIHAS